MDGNLAMANKLVDETEDENNFWADVYEYMRCHSCDKETAINEVFEMYKESCEF